MKKNDLCKNNEEWIKEPKTDVEFFINRFMCHNIGKSVLYSPDRFGSESFINNEVAERTRSHYRSGYCWHFAHLLKNVFNRGEVWAAPFSHIVFVDTDNTPYDIEGIYNGDAFWFIPEKYLGKYNIGFKHINEQSDKKYAPTRSALIKIMKKYCRRNRIKYDKSVEVYF